MGSRAYVLLDISGSKLDGRLEGVAKVLRAMPGVVTVDLLEGPPDIVMVVEASGRQELAELTVKALASVETMTENMCLLPASSERLSVFSDGDTEGN